MVDCENISKKCLCLQDDLQWKYELRHIRIIRNYWWWRRERKQPNITSVQFSSRSDNSVVDSPEDFKIIYLNLINNIFWDIIPGEGR